MKTLKKDIYLQFGVRRGDLSNFLGIFEHKGAHWADFDAFAALGTP
jgi:hypothetical protein